jgi:hypothetical protein
VAEERIGVWACRRAVAPANIFVSERLSPGRSKV